MIPAAIRRVAKDARPPATYTAKRTDVKLGPARSYIVAEASHERQRIAMDLRPDAPPENRGAAAPAPPPRGKSIATARTGRSRRTPRRVRGRRSAELAEPSLELSFLLFRRMDNPRALRKGQYTSGRLRCRDKSQRTWTT